MNAIDSTLTKSQEKAIIDMAEKAVGDLKKVRSALGSVIFGQEKVVENSLVAILGGGHACSSGYQVLPKPNSWNRLALCLILASTAFSSRPT